jgi:protein-S-isoprenylcysteine O-methyltransferase Ste14
MFARLLILFYALVSYAPILVGLQFEERDLPARFGTSYQRYRRRVPMLLPRILGRRAGAPR